MNVKLEKINKIEGLVKWVSWLNNKEVTRYSEQRLKKHTVTTQRNFIKSKLKDENSIIFKIMFNNEFIGALELRNINLYHKYCEITYMIGEKKLWGKNIGTTAIKLAIEIAFKKLKLQKVYAETFGKNIASQKVLLKNNFEIEGYGNNFFRISNSSNIRDSKITFGLGNRNSSMPLKEKVSIIRRISKDIGL